VVRWCLLCLALTLAVTGAAAAQTGEPRTVPTTQLVARLLHRSVVLRAAPGGRPRVRVGPRGVFGDPVVLGVVATRGNWVEVTSEALVNGRFGWVELGRDVRVAPVAFSLRVSLSRHELDVLREGRVVRRIAVAVGAPSTPTPVGRFSVAEKLPGARLSSSVYGCCIVGLTARQPHPPAGSSRTTAYYVAIHGGSGIGAAVSAGCLHAGEADLRYLMRTIPLGTAIRIGR
jgi:hypothetical protein